VPFFKDPWDSRPNSKNEKILQFFGSNGKVRSKAALKYAQFLLEKKRQPNQL